jgi:hypothetical protein
MMVDKKTATNAAGNGVIAPSVVAAAEQVIIEYRSIDGLKNNSHNARTHPDKQIQRIAASIKEFGFVVPVLVDEKGTILAGHGRAAAGRMLGMSQVPSVCVQHLTEAQKRAFMLADGIDWLSIPAGTSSSWPSSSRRCLTSTSTSILR